MKFKRKLNGENWEQQVSTLCNQERVDKQRALWDISLLLTASGRFNVVKIYKYVFFYYSWVLFILLLFFNFF